MNTLGAIVLSFVCFQGCVALWQRTLATTFEAYDIQPYLKSQILMHVPKLRNKATTYHLETGIIKAPAAPVNHWLKIRIYHGQPWWMVLYWPLWGTGICAAILLLLGIRADKHYKERVRLGLYVRGTEEISLREHNRRHPEPGLRLQVE